MLFAIRRQPCPAARPPAGATGPVATARGYLALLALAGLLAPSATRAAEPEALAAALAAWIEEEHGLNADDPLPAIALVPAGRLLSLRTGDPDAEGPPLAGGEVLAVYDDRSRTVFLSEDWTGASASDRSVLVHELVHHAQNLAGERFACPEEREAQAFRVQAHWLAVSGSDLHEAFGIDPFTLLVRTNCSP